jgi:hypothetical protein
LKIDTQETNILPTATIRKITSNYKKTGKNYHEKTVCIIKGQPTSLQKNHPDHLQVLSKKIHSHLLMKQRCREDIPERLTL